MPVTMRLAFSLLGVTWAFLVWLTVGRAILFLADITTLFGNSRSGLLTWIFRRNDDSLRKPVVFTHRCIVLAIIWLIP